jgi:hypothetical protein
LSTLQTLAAASGNDLPVAGDAPDAVAAPTQPQIHVALADAACVHRVASTLARFGWTAIEHASPAALLTSLQADPTPPALVIVDAQDAATVRALGAELSLLVVRPSDDDVTGLCEDEHTRIASADSLSRALIDVASRLRAAAGQSPRSAPAPAPLLRGAPRTVPGTTPAPHARASRSH